METVVFGFKSETIQNAIEREMVKLLKGTSHVQKVTKLTPRAIKDYLDKNPLTDAVVLVENGEEYQWKIEEICALTDAAEVNVVIVIDEAHRNTDYMQQLYRAGITSAIFFQEKKQGISPSTIARLVLKKRSRKDAREYYGIELIKNAVYLDENTMAAGYKSLADDTLGKNIMERYLKLTETMTAKQNQQFFKKMPRKLKARIIQYEEFYDFQQFLKEKGVNLGVRKPKKGLLSMIEQNEEEDTAYFEEPVRATEEKAEEEKTPDDLSKKETANQKVVVFAEIIDTPIEEEYGKEQETPFSDDYMDFSKFEEEMKKEEGTMQKETAGSDFVEKEEHQKDAKDLEELKQEETKSTKPPKEVQETKSFDDTTDFATLFSEFSEEENVEEEQKQEYENLEDDDTDIVDEEEEERLPISAMIGIGVCAVAVIIVVIVIVFVISSANRSNAAMSKYLANKQTAEIVNEVENEGIQTAEEDSYAESVVETSTQEDAQTEDVTIIGGETEEDTTVIIDTPYSDNQSQETTENTSQNTNTATQQVTTTQQSTQTTQSSQTTGNSNASNGNVQTSQTQTTSQTTQAQEQTEEEETTDNISDESSQDSDYKNKVLSTGEVYSGLEVLNYINANTGSYKIIGNDLEKTCAGGDVLPGDVVLSGSYKVTVKDNGAIIFLLQ